MAANHLAGSGPLNAHVPEVGVPGFRQEPGADIISRVAQVIGYVEWDGSGRRTRDHQVEPLVLAYLYVVCLLYTSDAAENREV